MNIIEKINASGRNQVTVILFHVLLGISLFFTNIVLIVYFLALSFYTILFVIRTRNHGYIFNYYLAYCVGMEILSRMARTSPFIPYELGKYITVFVTLFIISIQKYPGRGRSAWVIIFLSLPSIILQEYSNELFQDIVFNSFGMFGLAIMYMYFKGQYFTMESIRRMVMYFIFPCISILTYITLRTPVLTADDFQLGANFVTTGGFGSNQVSTLLGLIIMIILVFKLSNTYIFRFTIIDNFLLIYCLYRILLTFSRGGLVTSVISIIIFIIYNWRSVQMRREIKNPRVLGLILVLALAAVFSYNYVNNLSGNKLSARYQGENQNTNLGATEKDANIITSGRTRIVENDFRIFLSNPILGVGPGGSKYVRKLYGEEFYGDDINDVGTLSAAHIEFSRLFAEHGILGIGIIIAVIALSFESIRTKKTPMMKAFASAFICYSLLTTFHSATRTSMTPFMFGLAAANYIPDKKKIAKPKIRAHEESILR